MRKMVLLEDLSPYTHLLQQIAPHWEIIGTPSSETLEKHLSEAEIIVGWSSAAEKAIEEPSSPLKWVQAWSSGVDYLPLKILAEKGILLTNTAGIHPRPVSESIFAAMLALVRHLPHAFKAKEAGLWQREQVLATPLEEIHGKVLGVFGTGNIGQEVARIGRAFSMRTLGYKHTPELVPYFDEIFTGDDFYNLLSRCDYVVNLLPLTEGTRGLFDEQAFAAMPQGSRYLNFGRGETTDTSSLVEALESGHLAGAALDVTDPEPLPEESPLWKMDQVVITPHIAGKSVHYSQRVLDIFTENLKSYLQTGDVVKNKIDYQQAY